MGVFEDSLSPVQSRNIGCCLKASIILHNMLFRCCEKHDGIDDLIANNCKSDEDYARGELRTVPVRSGMVSDLCHLSSFQATVAQVVQDTQACGRLKQSLIELIWHLRGSSE
jgi:hypothetical protein